MNRFLKSLMFSVLKREFGGHLSTSFLPRLRISCVLIGSYLPISASNTTYKTGTSQILKYMYYNPS